MEELKEPPVQNTEPEHRQETSAQDLEEPEPVPALEPVHTATSTPVPPDPSLMTDSVGAVLQAENDDLDFTDLDPGSGPKKEVEEEGGAAPDAVKEGNICEHPEGTSTQQVQSHSCEQSQVVLLVMSKFSCSCVTSGS